MKRTPIRQAWFKRRKAIIAAIRLKHTLAAEDEINEVLDAEEKKFFKAVHQGTLPKALTPVQAQEVVGARR